MSAIPLFLGKTENGKLLELHDDAVTQGFADFGRRGMGKSNLLACMLEIFAVRRHPFVVLDPPDAHWGIRYSADAAGKPSGPSGFEVLIVGGDHADVPLNPDKGRELATIIVEGDISAVICMKSLSYTAMQRFGADFGEEMFRINRTPRFIGFEEAHNFLPQQLQFEEQKRVLYAMKKIIAEGRGSGLGFILASQRPSVVNKDALEEVDNFFVLGLIGPNDLKQIEGWFKHHVNRDRERLEAILDDIARMAPGECWFLSPIWQKEIVKFQARLRTTYHSGRTPKPGERPVNLAKFTVTEAVEKLKRLFSQKTIAVRQDVEDLASAKKRIRELERELKAKPAPREAAEQISARAVREATKDFERKRAELLRVNDHLFASLKSIAASASRALTATPPTKRANSEKDSVQDFKKGDVLAQREVRTPHSSPAPAPNKFTQWHPRLLKPVTTDEPLSHPQLRILKALADAEAIGRNTLGRVALAFFAKASPTSSSFDNNVGSLRSLGFVQYGAGKTVSLTEMGRAAAGSGDVLDTDALFQRVKELLSKPQGRVLDVLREVHPESLSRGELAERTGQSPSSSSFDNNVGEMSSRELLTYPDRGQVRCADWLFID